MRREIKLKTALDSDTAKKVVAAIKEAEDEESPGVDSGRSGARDIVVEGRAAGRDRAAARPGVRRRAQIRNQLPPDHAPSGPPRSSREIAQAATRTPSTASDTSRELVGPRRRARLGSLGRRHHRRQHLRLHRRGQERIDRRDCERRPPQGTGTCRARHRGRAAWCSAIKAELAGRSRRSISFWAPDAERSWSRSLSERGWLRADARSRAPRRARISSATCPTSATSRSAKGATTAARSARFR